MADVEPGRYSGDARSAGVGLAWVPIGLFFRILPFTYSDRYAIPYRSLIPAKPAAAVSAAAPIGQPRIGRSLILQGYVFPSGRDVLPLATTWPCYPSLLAEFYIY
ncbi:hypothetical protein NW759_016583 [Fusarium solani]|nr:hypothetical protein NW759_016583 [Fusarium solani]